MRLLAEIYAFGATLACSGGALTVVGPQQLTATSVELPGDFSSAAFLVVAASLVPLATPILMTLRLALKPGPAAWQIVASFVLTALTTGLLVWAAGRIFRVGILMQGQGAKLGDLFRWVIRG